MKKIYVPKSHPDRFGIEIEDDLKVYFGSKPIYDREQGTARILLRYYIKVGDKVFSLMVLENTFTTKIVSGDIVQLVELVENIEVSSWRELLPGEEKPRFLFTAPTQ